MVKGSASAVIVVVAVVAVISALINAFARLSFLALPGVKYEGVVNGKELRCIVGEVQNRTVKWYFSMYLPKK